MGHRRTWTTPSVGALLLLLVVAGPAGAITGGTPAPKQAPFDAVGQLLLAYEVGPEDAPLHLGICSGTYVDAPCYDDAFLTAAHCTYDADTFPQAIVGALESLLGQEVRYVGMQVTFDAAPWGDEPWTLEAGTATIDVNVDADGHVVQALGGFGTHPGRQDDRDVALLSLEAGPAGVQPVAVDTTSLTTLSRQQLRAATWVSVGYGMTYDRARGAPTMGPGGTRLMSEAAGGFLALRPGGLYLSQNQARGHGGTCYGDSGGPIFLEHGGTLRLVAITSWGDTSCIATNMTYRLDTVSARGVLG
jgi:hypothetical protein